MCFYFTTKVQIASAIIANGSQLSTNVPSQPLALCHHSPLMLTHRSRTVEGINPN